MWLECWINRASIINISTYRLLSGSSYISLPVELRSLRKGLINIKNKDQKCFIWCHATHDFSKIEVLNNICINVFGYEDELVFPIYVSDQKFEDSMDLLLLTDDYKSHYVYIKDFWQIYVSQNKN